MHIPRIVALPRLFTATLALAACGDDVTGQPPASTGEPDTGSDTADEPVPTSAGGFEPICTPGHERCDGDVREVCAPTGLEWQPEPCGDHQTCAEIPGAPAAECLGPCELASVQPSSLGCDFVAIRARSGNGEEDLSEFYDALIVGNPGDDAVEVQLFYTPVMSHQEAPEGEPVLLSPGESHIFELTAPTLDSFAGIRNGGVHRVRSDRPIAAYLHSPLKNSLSNDSSLLLPVSSLRKDHVIASYPAQVDADDPIQGVGGRPSYFDVIALEDDTKVEWTPGVANSAGNGANVFALAPGETGTAVLNRLDILQVGASSKDSIDFAGHDLSGTIVRADRPIWVLGATTCARVPFDSLGYCNHLQEQMIPTEYWGERYVAAHAPLRGQEKHYWRVYAGEDNVSVTTNPPQPGGNFKLEKKGDFHELTVEHGASFVFTGIGSFMPVQYLASYAEAGKIGDPAMYQTIPVEQHQSRYVFVTGVGYDLNYAQVVRRYGGPPVYLDGVEVEGYYFINGGQVGGDLRYEVADVPLAAGDEASVHVAESDRPFAVSVVGYTTTIGGGSAYAYPGGMALRYLNPQ